MNIMSSLSKSQVECLLRNCLPNGKIVGTDSDGGKYNDSIDTLWELFNNSSDKERNVDTNSINDEWYMKAYDYWESSENCPVTDNGVLGGFGHLTPMDARDSLIFLDKLKEIRPNFQFNRVADCGSGIGRVTKCTLAPRFEYITCVEQSPRLINATYSYLSKKSAHGDPKCVKHYNQGKVVWPLITTSDSNSQKKNDAILSLSKKLLVCDAVADCERRVDCLNIGLQHFLLLNNDIGTNSRTYDCIWIQWVIGHLSDLDYVQFLQRCALGLSDGGVIIIKDNVTDDCSYMIDCDDSSVARCIEYHHMLIAQSGLIVVHHAIQKDFPTDLCPVHMMALARPPTTTVSTTVGTTVDSGSVEPLTTVFDKVLP